METETEVKMAMVTRSCKTATARANEREQKSDINRAGEFDKGAEAGEGTAQPCPPQPSPASPICREYQTCLQRNGKERKQSRPCPCPCPAHKDEDKGKDQTLGMNIYV